MLASLLCVNACGPGATSGVRIDKEFRPVIPPDTKVLAGIDLDQLKTTQLYQRHEKELTLPGLQDSSQRFGIDPRRDISDVLVAWNGKRPLFLVRGHFQPANVEQKWTALRASHTTYKNHAVFGDTKNAVTFLSQTAAVEGSLADVERNIDLSGNSSDAVPEELQTRLKQVPRGDQIWIISRGGLPFADVPMRSDIESALSNIVNFVSGVTAGVKADAGVHIQIDITCVSEQGARRVHDALRGGIGLGRLTTKDNQRELLQIYDAINVDQDKTLVHVHADYSGQLTDSLIEQITHVRQALSH